MLILLGLIQIYILNLLTQQDASISWFFWKISIPKNNYNCIVIAEVVYSKDHRYKAHPGNYYV